VNHNHRQKLTFVPGAPATPGGPAIPGCPASPWTPCAPVSPGGPRSPGTPGCPASPGGPGGPGSPGSPCGNEETCVLAQDLNQVLDIPWSSGHVQDINHKQDMLGQWNFKTTHLQLYDCGSGYIDACFLQVLTASTQTKNNKFKCNIKNIKLS